MQTISARANLQPLQDRTRFHFLKKKPKGCADGEKEGPDRLLGLVLFVFLYAERCYSRKRKRGTSNSLIPQRETEEQREEEGEEAWSDCDGTEDSKHRIIWQQAKTRTQKIHSFIIREVALYRDGGNGVT